MTNELKRHIKKMKSLQKVLDDYTKKTQSAITILMNGNRPHFREAINDLYDISKEIKIMIDEICDDIKE